MIRRFAPVSTLAARAALAVLLVAPLMLLPVRLWHGHPAGHERAAHGQPSCSQADHSHERPDAPGAPDSHEDDCSVCQLAQLAAAETVSPVQIAHAAVADRVLPPVRVAAPQRLSLPISGRGPPAC